MKETFHLTSKLTTSADGETTSILTGVTADSLGGADLPSPSDTTGVTNFKYYYMVLMTISAQLDVPSDVLDKIDLNTPDVTITLKTAKDQEHTLRFYFYNSRHAYYTLDGQGQFYVVYDELTKFLSDTVLVVNGEAVNWETKNNTDVTINEEGEATVTPSENEKEDPADDAEMPKLIVVVIVVAAVLVVGGVGGFAVYAVSIKKKQKNE